MTYGPKGRDVTQFDAMIGTVMKTIKGEVGDEEMRFMSEDGRQFIFWYEHDCCANCQIEDICGDLSDLVGSPIVEAEEVTNYVPEGDPLAKRYYRPESFTWTFYRFSTGKGTVTVRWLGESNGYYSETVSYRVLETS